MSDKKWFILMDEKVQGPYRPSEILHEVLRGNWEQGRFWAKGKPHWMNLTEFRVEIEKDKSNDAQAQREEPTWYVKETGIKYGPLTYPTLLEFLKSRTNYKNILVSSDHANHWQEVYQIDSLMEKLGVNRRTHPRVPIHGKLTIQDGFLRGQQAALVSLSQGGLGAMGMKGLSIGEKFKASFTSPNLSLPIHFHGEVVFIGANDHVGIRFTNLSTEALAQIIAYVKQFVEAHPDIDFRRIA